MASWLALHRVTEHTSTSAPADHHGLGLSHYAQCTAPARRYADLTLLQQVSAELCGGRLPYEDSESLLRQHEAVRGRIKQTHALQRASENFWVLRYLQEACWRAGPALSVRAMLLAPYASSLARATAVIISGGQGGHSQRCERLRPGGDRTRRRRGAAAAQAAALARRDRGRAALKGTPLP